MFSMDNYEWQVSNITFLSTVIDTCDNRISIQIMLVSPSRHTRSHTAICKEKWPLCQNHAYSYKRWDVQSRSFPGFWLSLYLYPGMYPHSLGWHLAIKSRSTDHFRSAGAIGSMHKSLIAFQRAFAQILNSKISSIMAAI